MSVNETKIPLRRIPEQIQDKVYESDTAEKQVEKRSSRTETKSLSLFEHIVQIGTLHEKEGGKPERIIEQAKKHIDFVRKRLGLTPLQTVLLADVLYVSDGECVTARDLAKLMQCRPIEIYGYLDQFEHIERKSILEVDTEVNRSRGISIKIPFETVQAIQKGKCPENRWTKGLTPQEFMEKAATLYDERINDHVDYARSLKNLRFLLEANMQLEFVQAIRSYGLNDHDKLILLRFCVTHVIFGEELSMNELDAYFRCRSMFSKTKIELHKGKHALQEKGIIEYVNHGGFSQRDFFCLTETAKDKLFAEYENILVDKTITGLVDPDAIGEKSLFYPEKTTRSVVELVDLLQEENWRRVRENLHEKGMRTGFACLFSGEPGTGKTETAMQIARMTGRPIMQVDISETKSMWFGESEKRIKAVFNRYRAAVKCSETTPILLFNEADAVIGKRQELGPSRNGPGQTENAIQNIILQEIENLDGILIATTNLSVNMDKAFERRFLYKIEFEKPTLDARKSIWQTMIPELPVEDITILAERYEFSGGQIENISRRCTVAQVLHGKAPSLEEMIDFCREEQTCNDTTKRIGFM